MNDDISRQAAIEAICKACSMEGDYHKCDGYPETSIWCDYLVALRALPSVQPERKKGKWIQPCDITGFGRCSNCNALWNNSLIENRFFRYCPRCGADMRGDKA